MRLELLKGLGSLTGLLMWIVLSVFSVLSFLSVWSVLSVLSINLGRLVAFFIFPLKIQNKKARLNADIPFSFDWTFGSLFRPNVSIYKLNNI